MQHLDSDYLKYYSKLDFQEIGELFPTRKTIIKCLVKDF